MTRTVAIAGLLTTVASSLAAQQIVGREEATFSLSQAVRAGAWVRIASPNGSIRITEARGGEVEIRAEKHARRGSVEDLGFVVWREDGGLTVCAVYEDADECDADGRYRSRGRSWRGSRQPDVRADFTVRVPAGMRVRAGSGNGDVIIDGGGPEVIAATGNGRVEVTGADGEVEASTGNGGVLVADAGGPVDASTGSGSIRIATAVGPVSASSGNGSIDVTMDRLTGTADMRFSTGNGRIVVRVPDGFGAELDASTGNGSVVVDIPLRTRGRMDRSRVRGTLGDGGGRLVLISGNGDLEVIRRS